jgi:hypothetical protein
MPGAFLNVTALGTIFILIQRTERKRLFLVIMKSKKVSPSLSKSNLDLSNNFVSSYHNIRELCTIIPMCDPVLIAAILEELGYFDDKKEKDKKDEVRGDRSHKDNKENSWKEQQKLIE